MGGEGRSYLEHCCIYVKDIKWHIDFFREVFGMDIRYIVGTPEDPRQIWLKGGIQMYASPNFDGLEGRMAHYGIMTENLAECLEKAYACGCTTMEGGKGRNWIRLPDGLCIEVMQANDGAVDKYFENLPLLGCYSPHNPNPRDNV